MFDLLLTADVSKKKLLQRPPYSVALFSVDQVKKLTTYAVNTWVWIIIKFHYLSVLSRSMHQWPVTGADENRIGYFTLLCSEKLATFSEIEVVKERFFQTVGYST